MEIVQPYQPFELQEIVLDTWEQRAVKNNFFELVWIKEGKGTQCINYNYYEYKAGSLFLLPPLKCHAFQIKQKTQFVFLKFTANFLGMGGRGMVNPTAWFDEAAYVLANYNQLPGEIIKEARDRQYIYTLVDLIQQEERQRQSNSYALIKSFTASILEILLRNIKQGPAYEIAVQDEPDQRITKLLTYINEHIATPHLLKVEALAKTFLLSPNYLSEFFRKKVNMSLRTYIIRAKLKRVEIRLLNSAYTLSEIADELGFTDASHLSKVFKRHTGMSIRAFKERGEYQLLKRSTC